MRILPQIERLQRDQLVGNRIVQFALDSGAFVMRFVVLHSHLGKIADRDGNHLNLISSAP